MESQEPRPLFPEYEVRGIRFSVSDPADIISQSVVEVSEPNLYSKGLPTARAPNDLKMGSVDRRMRCSKCVCVSMYVSIHFCFPPSTHTTFLYILRSQAHVGTACQRAWGTVATYNSRCPCATGS